MDSRTIATALITCVLTTRICLAVSPAAQSAIEKERARNTGNLSAYTPPLERPGDPPAPAEILSGRTSSAAASVVFGNHTSVQVNVDGAGNNIVGDAANEPSMAISSADSKKLAIGWRQFDSVSSNFRQAGVGHSINGGQTWTSTGPLDAGRFRSDPVLASDGFGNLFYSSLTLNEFDPNIFEVYVFKSTDGGATWPTSTYSFGGDKQWLIADVSAAGLSAGHIYQSWNVQFSCCGSTDFTRSIDSGASYENPLELPYPRMKWATLNTNWAGVLYMGGASLDQTGHLFVRSQDAQDPGAPPTFEPPVFVNLGGFTGGFGGFDGPNPAGLLGQVWVAAHPGEDQYDHVYMLGSVIRFGDETDVMFARSVDGGKTWSEPIRVNDDPEGNGAWQWFGAMSVAPNGRIDVTWNDTRTTGDARLSAVYHSFSLDEGQTWSPNEQISPVFNSHLGFPNQNKMGDYTHMISDDGGANLAYAATFNGEQDVYFIRIKQDCNANGIDDDCDVRCGEAGTRCNVAGCGQSQDCNGNRIPDTCEPNDDCDENGQQDTCEIGNVPALDCNANRRIDTCENPNDCNSNGDPDVCDLFAHGDCNGNGTPDDCDAGTTSSDRNGDDVPDECQGSCCFCGPCFDIGEVECSFYGGIFAGPDILCGEPNSCVSPLFEHDVCAQAFELPSAPVYRTDFDNRCAGWEKPYEVACPGSTLLGPDLWYTYKAPCDGTVEFSTCETTDFDAMLAIYSTGTTCSCPTSDASLVSCADDSCGFQGGPPVITRAVVAGQCYTVRFGGWEGSVGTGDLSISYLTSCNPTDLNASGNTDLRDFAIFQNCYGPVGQGCGPSDFNHDGVVNINDYLAFHAMMGL